MKIEITDIIITEVLKTKGVFGERLGKPEKLLSIMPQNPNETSIILDKFTLNCLLERLKEQL